MPAVQDAFITLLLPAIVCGYLLGSYAMQLWPPFCELRLGYCGHLLFVETEIAFI